MRDKKRLLCMVLACAALGADQAVAWEAPKSYGIGQNAASADIQPWDIDVMPDGTGLPPGSGTVTKGAAVFAQKCAACHGTTGAEGPYETLVGTVSLRDEIQSRKRPARTIGNLWPYAPVLFDYIRRTMPFTEPGTLTNDEVYSVVAWLLNRNGLVPPDATVDARVLSTMKMPGAALYVSDPRRPWVVQ